MSRVNWEGFLSIEKNCAALRWTWPTRVTQLELWQIGAPLSLTPRSGAVAVPNVRNVCGNFACAAPITKDLGHKLAASASRARHWGVTALLLTLVWRAWGDLLPTALATWLSFAKTWLINQSKSKTFLDLRFAFQMTQLRAIFMPVGALVKQQLHSWLPNYKRPSCNSQLAHSVTLWVPPLHPHALLPFAKGYETLYASTNFGRATYSCSLAVMPRYAIEISILIFFVVAAAAATWQY